MPWHRAITAWLDQRGHLFAWVPVMLACGIALYFGLKSEPPLWVYAALAGGVGMALALLRYVGARLAPVIWAVALVAIGLCIAAARAHGVADAKLGWRYYGPVEGRVVDIDRSGSDALRVTLDRVVLRYMAPERTPGRVRVSFHGAAEGADPQPGETLILTAHLSPPAGPVEPGASISSGTRGSRGWGRWAIPARLSCCWNRRRAGRSCSRRAWRCRAVSRRRCRASPGRSRRRS